MIPPAAGVETRRDPDRTKDVRFAYDAFYRLSAAETAGSHWGLQWTYDRYGNRLSQTASKGTGPPDHNPTVSASTNRVLNVGAQTWSYDAAGNATNDGSRTYAYDANNRITQVGGGSPAEYRYDGEGNRVMKVVGSDTIRYVMGLAEHSTATGWRALYVYLGSEKLVEYRYANSTRFFHNDHLGTTKAVTDHTGAVLERWDHYPFGEEWVSGLTGDRYRYTGHLRDQETGNDYAGARYYTNARGRWLSVDPVRGNVANPQRLNRYSYVGNDPVNIVDPDGMEWRFARTLHYFWPEAELWIVGEIWDFTRSGPGPGGGTGAFGEGGRGGGVPMANGQKFMSKADFKDFLSERLSRRCQEYLKGRLGGGILDRMAGDVEVVAFWRMSAPFGVGEVKMTDLGKGSFVADTIGEYWDRVAGRADALVVRNVEGDLLPHVLLGTTFGYKSTWEQGMIMTHEMLHYSTKMGDVELAERLGLIPTGSPTQAGSASAAIRDFMHRHDCDLESYRGSFP